MLNAEEQLRPDFLQLDPELANFRAIIKSRQPQNALETSEVPLIHSSRAEQGEENVVKCSTEEINLKIQEAIDRSLKNLHGGDDTEFNVKLRYYYKKYFGTETIDPESIVANQVSSSEMITKYGAGTIAAENTTGNYSKSSSVKGSIVQSVDGTAGNVQTNDIAPTDYKSRYGKPAEITSANGTSSHTAQAGPMDSKYTSTSKYSQSSTLPASYAKSNASGNASNPEDKKATGNVQQSTQVQASDANSNSYKTTGGTYQSYSGARDVKAGGTGTTYTAPANTSKSTTTYGGSKYTPSSYTKK